MPFDGAAFGRLLADVYPIIEQDRDLVLGLWSLKLGMLDLLQQQAMVHARVASGAPLESGFEGGMASYYREKARTLVPRINAALLAMEQRHGIRDPEGWPDRDDALAANEADGDGQAETASAAPPT